MSLKPMKRRKSPIVLLLVTLAAGSCLAADTYHVVSHFPLAHPGTVAAIALDPAGRNLYVGNGTFVTVLNADSGKQVASLPLAGTVTGLAIAPQSHRLFVSSRGGPVEIFDTASFRQLEKIPGSGGAPALSYDSGTQKVFVENSARDSISAFDAASGKLSGTTRVGSGLGQMIANGYGRLFIAAPQSNQIYEVDTETMKSLGAFPSRYGKHCGGLALDPVGRRLFVACRDGVVNVIDTDVGFTFQQLRSGSGASDATFTFKPQGKAGWKGAAFVASSDGTLTALKMNSYVSYGAGASTRIANEIRGVVFDPKTNRVFVAAPVAGDSHASGSASDWEVLALAD